MKNQLLHLFIFLLLIVSRGAYATPIDEFLRSHDGFEKSELVDPNIPSDAIYTKKSETIDVAVFVRSEEIIAYEFLLKIPNVDTDSLMSGSKASIMKLFPEEKYSINQLNGQLAPGGKTFQLAIQILDTQLFADARKAKSKEAGSIILDSLSEFAPTIQP